MLHETTTGGKLDERTAHRRLLYIVGTTIAALTVLAIAAMWLTVDLGSRAVPGVPSGTWASPPLFGFPHWGRLFEVASVAMFVITATLVVTSCIEKREVTVGAMFFVSGLGLYSLDPFGNWAPYAVYDPQMLHWPVSWPWASIAPNIEPVVGLVGYFGFYLGIPLTAIWLLRERIMPRVGSESFIRRRPLLSLTLVTIGVGFVLDALVEVFMIRTGMLMYLQVVPFGSVWVGTRYQFPLLWQSVATTIPFVFAALLWWRDDEGVTTAVRLSRRLPVLRRWGRTGTFVLIYGALTTGYVLFMTPYAIIHKTGLATGTAQPFLYCDSAVPDPNGLMRLNGQPGPYLSGWWPGPYHTEPTRNSPPPADECPRGQT